MVDKLFNPLTLLVGPCLVSYLIYKSTIPVEQGGYHLPWWNILLSYMVWLTATRTAKLLPHLWHRPQDIIYVPAFILFGYYFAIMKIYALFTLHETGWGTRAGIGDASAATAAMEAEQRQENEKANANNPYHQQQQRYQPPPSGYGEPMSPFRDQQTPSPLAIHRPRRHPRTRVHVAATAGAWCEAESRARGGCGEMQVGYAR
ncbi:hypothetical protein Hypma_003098 [Hypsizygus marmoreus]|uniref:Uncharacterized protein n=1 Tax=Hypsizygus marmoreus TaxID=39966 RepID=A0A369J4B6_HYPMA|nr:hypothetical protein Hypma_003098 [Hypsizygus marmoreus]